jgi:hypothetical protein
MSDIANPLETVFERVKVMIVNLQNSRRMIDFMRGAGEDVTSHEISYRNQAIRVEKWKSQLEAEGFKF